MKSTHIVRVPGLDGPYDVYGIDDIDSKLREYVSTHRGASGQLRTSEIFWAECDTLLDARLVYMRGNARTF